MRKKRGAKSLLDSSPGFQLNGGSGSGNEYKIRQSKKADLPYTKFEGLVKNLNIVH